MCVQVAGLALVWLTPSAGLTSPKALTAHSCVWVRPVAIDTFTVVRRRPAFEARVVTLTGVTLIRCGPCAGLTRLVTDLDSAIRRIWVGRVSGDTLTGVRCHTNELGVL
jgi:hypothetical protein